MCAWWNSLDRLARIRMLSGSVFLVDQSAMILSSLKSELLSHSSTIPWDQKMTLGTPTTLLDTTERGFYFDLALKSEAFVESCQRPPSQWPEKETRLPLQWEEGNSPKPRSPLWPDPLNPLQYWKIKARNLCELCVFEQCPAHALGHWQSRKVEAEFWYTKCASRSSLEKKQIGPIVDGSINEAEWRQCSLFWKSTWLKRSLGYPQRDEWECIYNTYRAVLSWGTND